MRRGFPALIATLAATASAALAPAAASAATTTGPSYITVDDGTQIAVCISTPAGFKADGSRKWPAIFEQDGYGGCGHNDDNEFLGNSDKYVVVYTQTRGTGCSGGQLDLFSQRSARDGRFIIDNWIEKQPWSDGNVGITGHSYSGLMGYLTAETQPHIKAIALSGLIDDFYRGILYPGGIFNPGFPVLWGAGLRPADEFGGNYDHVMNDPTCQANQAQHQGSDTVPVQLIAPVYTQSTATPDSWAISHSLVNHNDQINAPIEIHQQYQDEQTGPHGGPILWQRLPAGLPKRLVLSSGMHNPNDPAGDKKAWLDCWLIDKPSGAPCPTVAGTTDAGEKVSRAVDDSANRVVEYFAEQTNGARGTPYLAADWPDPHTDWQRLYLRADHTLAPRPDGGNGNVRYISTSTDEHTSGQLGLQRSANTGQVTFAHGPNEARFTIAFPRATAISGPALLDLYLRSSAPSTDVWADVLDRDPSTGAMSYLQRGLLRSSFRLVDGPLSDRIASGPLKGTIYRPYHDYLTEQLALPGTVMHLPIDIFPFGHVFPPGHELVIDVHAPPASDPLSTYAFEPKAVPSVNTIEQLPGQRSTLLVPFMPVVPGTAIANPPCATTDGYVCFTPAR